MLAFVIRRLIGMVAVLFAVSLLVFIVFILIPGVGFLLSLIHI